MLARPSKYLKELFQNLNNTIKYLFFFVLLALVCLMGGCLGHLCTNSQNEESTAPEQIIIQIELPAQGEVFYATTTVKRKGQYELNLE